MPTAVRYSAPPSAPPSEPGSGRSSAGFSSFFSSRIPTTARTMTPPTTFQANEALVVSAIAPMTTGPTDQPAPAMSYTVAVMRPRWDDGVWLARNTDCRIVNVTSPAVKTKMAKRKSGKMRLAPSRK